MPSFIDLPPLEGEDSNSTARPEDEWGGADDATDAGEEGGAVEGGGADSDWVESPPSVTQSGGNDISLDGFGL